MDDEGEEFMAAVHAAAKARRSASQRAYRQRHPERRKAYQFVQLALFFGYLKRPNRCEKCKRRRKPEAHHTDYMKPLDIQWLCKSCHEEEHHAGSNA